MIKRRVTAGQCCRGRQLQKRRIELSGTYVVASTMATVTGAVIASFFGVAGTIIGTAVISVASTVGAAIYQATLRRGQEQLREIPAAVSRARAYRTTGHGAHYADPDASTVAGYADITDPAEGSGAANDGLSPAGEDNATIVAGEPVTAATATAAADADAAHGVGPAESEATRAEGDSGGAGDIGSVTAAAPQGGDAGAGQPEGAGQTEPAGPDGDGSLWTRIGWKRVATATVAVFVVAIGVVTVIELLAGKPLNAVVHGGHTSGTSVSSLFGGRPAASPSARQPSPRPSGPSITPRATTSTQPAHLSSPAPNRSNGRTPAPSPSTVPTTIPGNGPPPTAPIPPAGDPSGGSAQSPGGRGGTSAQGWPTP